MTGFTFWDAMHTWDMISALVHYAHLHELNCSGVLEGMRSQVVTLVKCL